MTLTGNFIRRGVYLVGMPLLPADLAVPVDGDVYPVSRAIGWGYIGGKTSPGYTWVASVESGTVVTIVQQTLGYYIYDLSSTLPGALTMTGHRPRNPIGGVARFNEVIGTSNLKDGGFTLDHFPARVEHEPVLVGNALVDCTKLPPLCTQLSLPFIAQNPPVIDFFTLHTYNPALPAGATYKLLRWFGGDLHVDNLGLFTPSFEIFVVQTNPVTLNAFTAAEVHVGTVPNNTLTTITAATLGATLTRWGHFWIYVKLTIPGPSITGPTILVIAPNDIPPTYDAPGRDGALLGGYLT